VPWVSCAVAVLSLILLIVIGVTQVRPYDQSQHFQKTECKVHTITYNSSRTCDISPGSLGSYNCIEVTVVFKDMEDDLQSTLYDTEKELHEAKCSFIPRICSIETAENNHLVDIFEKSLAPDYFPCLRDPKDNSRVIRRREVTHSRAIHMLLWPTFLLVISIVIAVWGMVKAPRRTNISYIEVPEKRGRRSIYKLNSQEDREVLTEEQ